MPLSLFTTPGSPEEKLAAFQRKMDWAGLARTYYDLGVAAMEGGELEHAQLWLHRADTIYSANDDVYDKVGEELIDDCSERIDALEDEEMLFYNSALAEVEEKAAELGDSQRRVWGLLSAARLVHLCTRLSALPGCEVLGELDWAVDTILRSMQEAPSQKEYQLLLDIAMALYELNGKPVYYTGEILVPGKAPFQLFDLNGLYGAEEDFSAFINDHLELVDALSRGMEPPEAGSDVVVCALLPDYYVRTGAGALEDVPQISAEMVRIRADFDFVRSGPTWEQVAERMEGYKRLNPLA